MGFLDALLGGRKSLKAPAPDRLFAMSTAYVTIEAQLGLKHKPVAGIVFQPLATADFKQILADTEEQFEDLVVSVNVISTQLEGGGYGDRILCAVFAFEDEGRPVYFIYNYKRGAWYPFVPAPGEKQRNNEREFQVKAAIGGELPFEQEIERWFPLWEIPL